MVRCLPLILILVPFSVKAGCWFTCEPLFYKFTQRGFYMQCQLRCFSSPVIIDLPGDDGVPGDDSNVSGGGDDDNSPSSPPPQVKLDCIDQIMNHNGIIYNFGDPTIMPNGDTGPHTGVDLAAPSGTAVRSPISGTVSFFRDDLARNERGNTLEGNYIQINAVHEQTFDAEGNLIPGRIQILILAHLDEHFGRNLGLSNGQVIKAGDVIAYSDNTGQIEGAPPHLHLSIWEGDLVDPLNQFPENCGGQ